MAQSVQIGGGGNRTRVLGDATSIADSKLHQPPGQMAALWLQLEVVKEHDMARLGTIINAWPTLPEHIRLAVESLCRVGGRLDRD